MALLPDTYGRRRVPRSRRGVVPERGAGQIAEAVGEVAGQFERVVEAKRDKDDKYSYAKAKSSLLRADLDARKELENDQDYKSHDERYRKRMDEARANALGMIGSASDRKMFELDSELDVERGADHIRTASRKIEVDFERAGINDAIEANRDALLATTDAESRMRVIQATQGIIDGGVEQGFLNQQEGSSLRQSWTEGTARAAVEMMTPAEQVAALSDDYGQEILEENSELNFVQRAIALAGPNADDQLVIDNGDGTTSTHKMAAEQDAEGNWYVFPNIIEVDGELVELSPEDATALALEGGGESIAFGKDADAALQFAEGGYKAAAGWPGSRPGNISDFIDPDVKAEMLQNAIKTRDTENNRQASQTAADAIYSTDLPIRDQLATAREIDDPKVRDDTVTRLKSRHAEDMAIVEEVRVKNLTDAYEIIDGGGTTDSIPADLWARLSATDQKAVKIYAQPGKTVTNLETWYTLERMKASDPEKFQSLNLLDYRSQLDDTQFRKMAEAQTEDAEGGYQLRNDNQMVDAALRQMKVDPSPSANKSNVEKSSSFRWAFQQNVDELQRREERKATVDEKQQIIDDLTVDVVTVVDWGFDITRPAFELEADVPAADIADYVASLTASGMQVNKANIEELHRLTLFDEAAK